MGEVVTCLTSASVAGASDGAHDEVVEVEAAGVEVDEVEAVEAEVDEAAGRFG
jgi:hypothetical protein